MTEKTKRLFSLGNKEEWKDFALKKAVWVFAGIALETGASDLSAAPAAYALLAGVSGAKTWYVLAGGILGAVIHGFPAAFTSIAAMAIVLAARMLPDLKRVSVRAVERFFAAAGACFFSRVTLAESTADFLAVAVAAVCAGAFAASIVRLESALEKGIDLKKPTVRAHFGVAAGLAFLSLGALDYPFANIGRLVFGAVFLYILSEKSLEAALTAGVAGLFGLCAADSEMGAGAAGFALAAVACGMFKKRGKIVCALGYVFFAAAGTLVSGADEGSIRIMTETIITAAIYVVMPKAKPKESAGISDNTAAMLLCERLNYAADALRGVGAGISAASEALEEKYAFTSESIAERAADRVCRSCPKSMLCWGEKYELFRAEFERLVEQLRTGFPLTDNSMNGECAQICVYPSGVANALTEEYSRYLSAKRDEQRIGEIRRIYSDRLLSTEQILRDLSRADILDDPDREAEKRAEKLLYDAGVRKPRAFVTAGENGLHFEAYGETEPIIDREYLGKLIGQTLGRAVDVPEISGSGGMYRITANKAHALSLKLGAFQLPKGENDVCGDCYDSFTDADGVFYVILSDGMGTGSRARVDSAMACSVAAKLIKSGISLSAALETVNTVMMIKSSDESYATLDICRIDPDSGECAIYKAGAAATYIRSSDRLIRVSLSSAPAGTGGKINLPAQRLKVSAGDMIVMITDGAVIDERWLARELSAPTPPDELSERIARAARAADSGKDDDISVVAVEVSGRR